METKQDNRVHRRAYDTMHVHWDSHWGQTRWADEYATNFYPRRQEEFQTICKYLPRDLTVLEAGCAYGHVVKYFQEQGYSMLGLDYAAQALQIGIEKEPRLKLVQGDIHALPFADNALGGYLSFGVLEHFVSGPLPALREAYRVLRPGGVAAITMPLPAPLVREWIPRIRPWVRLEPLKRNPLLRQVFGKKPIVPTTGSLSTFYEQPYTREQVRAFLGAAGFRVVHQIPIYHAYWIYLIGGPFRDSSGYYLENQLGEQLAKVTRKFLPWSTAFFSLAIGLK